MNPLSVRNNNPGNMRPVGSNGGFQSFGSPDEGMSAMRRDLLVKVLGKSNAMKANYGDNYQPSLKNLISTWAPPTENDTNSYVNFVSQKTGIKPDQILAEADVDKLMPAMIEQEGGGKAASYFQQQQEAPLTPEEEAELAGYEAEAPLTPEEQAELAGYETETQQPQLTPAQTFQNENPLLRTIGRGGRIIASGLGSMADVALLPAKTAILGAGLATGNEQLQKVGMTPSMHDSTQGVIDQATGDRLKPMGFGEKAVDFGGEMLTGAGFSSLPQRAATQAPGIVDAVRGVMNPAEVLGNLPQYRVPGPGSTTAKTTSDQLRAKGSQQYKAANEKGGMLKPEVVNKWVDDLYNLQPSSERVRSIGGKDKFSQVLEDVKSLYRDTHLDLDEAQQLDEKLADLVDYDLGRPTKEGLKIIKIQTSLRNAIDEATEDMVIGGKEGFQALKDARGTWSKSLRLRDIERIMQRAEQMDVPATGYKTGFRTLYNNPDRMRGYTAQEKEAIRKIAEGGPVGDLLKTFGSRLIGIGAAVKGGPVGAGAGYALSTASRGAANKLAASKAEKIADLVRGQSQNVSAPLSAKQKAIAAALANTTARGQ